MTRMAADAPLPSSTILAAWGLDATDYLGGNSDQRWLVERGGTRLVLRRHADDALDIEYEMAVLRRLRAVGLPVPEPVAEPITAGGGRWSLFTWLPGAPSPVRDAKERRARGRLLAELHASLGGLRDLGQRRGYALADEVVRDPGLAQAIEEYEAISPVESRIMGWHLREAVARFAAVDLGSVEQITLHGDFAPWNLLFENGKLSGILDFEATHLNYRVSDFALSWRGYQDEVIEGYEEVQKLTETDRELLMPCYWAWIFLGVKDEIRAILAGQKPAHAFEWRTRHLTRRDGKFGRLVADYRLT